MARIYTEHAAWGNNNGLSELNGFVFLGWCTTCSVGAAETAAPP